MAFFKKHKRALKNKKELALKKKNKSKQIYTGIKTAPINIDLVTKTYNVLSKYYGGYIEARLTKYSTAKLQKYIANILATKPVFQTNHFKCFKNKKLSKQLAQIYSGQAIIKPLLKLHPNIKQIIFDGIDLKYVIGKKTFTYGEQKDESKTYLTPLIIRLIVSHLASNLESDQQLSPSMPIIHYPYQHWMVTLVSTVFAHQSKSPIFTLNRISSLLQPVSTDDELKVFHKLAHQYPAFMNQDLPVHQNRDNLKKLKNLGTRLHLDWHTVRNMFNDFYQLGFIRRLINVRPNLVQLVYNGNTLYGTFNEPRGTRVVQQLAPNPSLKFKKFPTEEVQTWLNVITHNHSSKLYESNFIGMFSWHVNVTPLAKGNHFLIMSRL